MGYAAPEHSADAGRACPLVTGHNSGPGLSSRRARQPSRALRAPCRPSVRPSLLPLAIVQHPRTWERGFRGVMDPVTGFRLEYVAIKGKRSFQGVRPRRWVVERTFSWLLHSRRLARDYERLPSTDEALIYATMARLMTRRLARRRMTPISNSL